MDWVGGGEDGESGVGAWVGYLLGDCGWRILMEREMGE